MENEKLATENKLKEIRTVAIVGLGLIGGSYAKAIKKKTGLTVWGSDLNRAVVQAALEGGIIDGEATPTHVARADLVMVCLYPETTRRYIHEQAGHFRKDAIVTDACGVKGALCAEMEEVAAQYGFHFVGSHPMAGKERGGLDNAAAGLFEGANFIMTPSEAVDGRAVEALADLAKSLGFGRIVRSTPKEHDRMIAYTSQLPHVLACAYVHSPSCQKQAAFSAGSYRDVSRVAHINEEMWSSLFLLNIDPLCEEIDLLIDNLSMLKEHIVQGDREGLAALLRSGREIKEGYGA